VRLMTDRESATDILHLTKYTQKNEKTDREKIQRCCTSV
jgi:hypothetical protein